MNTLGPEAQQLYTIAALARRASITHREQVILKSQCLQPRTSPPPTPP